MRLKSSLHAVADEDGFLVKNHNLNERFGEKTTDFSSIGKHNLNPEEVTSFHQERWPLLDSRAKQMSGLNENMCGLGYTPQMPSPSEDADDRYISSPEEQRPDVKGKCEDSASDFSETSPLLGDFDEMNSADEEEDFEDPSSPRSSGIGDCNNNMQHSVSEESEYSVCSDLSEMTDSKDEYYFVMENNYNNNFQRDTLLVTNFRNRFCTDDDGGEKDVILSDSVSPIHDGTDVVLPTSVVTNSSSGSNNTDEFISLSDNGCQLLKDVLPTVEQEPLVDEHVALSSNSEGGTSPISESSPGEIDVNLVTCSFNNFALSASKHNDILSLVEAKQSSRQANIQETEPKILNTGHENLPRNMTKEYQYRLRNKDYPRNGACISFKDPIGCAQDDSAVADGRFSSGSDVVHFDRASTVSDRESTRDLPADGAKVSNVICDESSQSLTLPLETGVSESAEDKLYGDSQLSVNDNSDLKISPSWFDTEKVGRIPRSLDAESPTDNLIPAESVPTEQPPKETNPNPPECPETSEVGKRTPDTSAGKNLSSSSTCCRNPAAVHAKCKMMSPGRELFGDFDVYNIETTMPTIDWVAMEAHLARAAKEDDWLIRRRNDREEIRRKLAMDSDSEDYYCGERVTRKPSLSTRLQSGMNLQICFMNEAASDQDSQGSDQDLEGVSPGENTELSSPPTSEKSSMLLRLEDTTSLSLLERSTLENIGTPTAILNENSQFDDSNNSKITMTSKQRPTFFFSRQRSWHPQLLKADQQQQTLCHQKDALEPGEDFYTCHARLQAEARMALAQAKEMARMQMEVERQRSKKSPISEIVGLPFPDNRHHISRQVLTDMNVAQLQVIVNDLHTQIENLNEELVQLLLNRDDLHMEQDSMLVDIEDLTRYLGAKDEGLQNLQTSVEKQSIPQLAQMLKSNADK